MAWTIYRSTDTDAPVLTGEVGKLVDLLDDCLVNGYGAKAAAGWSKVYSGTNKAVYRPGVAARARPFIRIDDNSPDSHAGYCRLSAFEDMQDVDTGDAEWTYFASSPYFYPRKSTTADSTARPWIVAADDRTCLLLINNGFSGSRYHGTYIGEFFSHVPSDSYQACVIGRRNFSTAAPSTAYSVDNFGWSESQLSTADSNMGTYPGGVIMRDYDGTPDLASCSTIAHGAARLFGVGLLSGTNPADGELWFTDMPLITNRGAVCLRGKLRGCWLGLWTQEFFAGGDIFSGTGEMAGKSFEIISLASARDNSSDWTNFVLETSDTVAAS
jgi:hypothetical protein